MFIYVLVKSFLCNLVDFVLKMEKDNEPSTSTQESEISEKEKTKIEAPLHVKSSGNSILVSPRQASTFLQTFISVPT